MNDFERSLVRLPPDAAGLDADRMLFVAGLAVGRRGRNSLAILAGMMTLCCIGLGVWGWSERAERRRLIAQVREQSPAQYAPASGQSVEPSSAVSTEGYMRLRRRAEQDPNGWLASWQPAEMPGPPEPEPVILRAWQRDGPIDQ